MHILFIVSSPPLPLVLTLTNTLFPPTFLWVNKSTKEEAGQGHENESLFNSILRMGISG